ncbi:hypothetical protein PO909_021395 [Leuciscus waleckii]
MMLCSLSLSYVPTPGEMRWKCPGSGPTHLRTDITHQECYEYTRFLRDRRVTFRDFVKCIRFISNKRRSLAVHMANFGLI